MTETEYINATNIAKARDALKILADYLPLDRPLDAHYHEARRALTALVAAQVSLIDVGSDGPHIDDEPGSQG